MRILMLVLGVLAAAQAGAGIYKTYDKNGNVVYSDDPAGESVQTRETMVVPALPKKVIDQKLNRKGKDETPGAAEPREYAIKILKPAPEQTLQHGEDAFNMDFEIEPELGKSHHVEVFLNGDRLSRDNYSPTIDPQTLPRGEQRLEVVVVDKKGMRISATAINFHIFQPTEIAPD